MAPPAELDDITGAYDAAYVGGRGSASGITAEAGQGMALDPKKQDGFEYEHHEINWTAGVGRPAGVYWLDGRSVIVAHESPGEERLLSEGAVLVATLRFDRDPLDASHAGRTVERVAARRISGEFFLSGIN
jgi:hypothetical protein